MQVFGFTSVTHTNLKSFSKNQCGLTGTAEVL